MKKIIFTLLTFSLLLQTHSVQAAIDCHVVEKSGDGEGSLPWQIDRVNQGICGSVIFTLMEAPLKVTLTEPLHISDDYAAMISGADYEAEGPWPPLGVVIDARAVPGCAFFIEKPKAFSVKALSFWVNDWDEAICDFEGRSILRKGSPGYIGDALTAKYYSQLQICEGPNQAQSCTVAPLPPFASLPKGPGDFKLPPLPPLPPGPGDIQDKPKPPLPPGPGDVVNCSDADDDGLCDAVDRCNLSPNNPQADALGELMDQQCPAHEKNSSLCSQTQDADHDGLGNACDADADADGFDNNTEKAADSDPLDPASFP